MTYSKYFSCVVLVSGLFFIFTGLAFAGGSVTYSNGLPAVGVQVIITGAGQGKTIVTCDSEGYFELDSLPDNAMVRIKAKDKNYAPLKLPAGLFTSGNVAIVLQPKDSKSKSNK